MLADFFDHASVGLHWVGPDGVILRVNQTELDLLGFERDEYVGRHIAEFHEDQEVIADILERLQSRETLCDYQARLRCKNGAIRHVLINSNVLWEDGEFIHTRCFTRDVTRQRQAEKALRESEARNRTLVEHAPSAIVLHDLDEHRFVDCNSEALRLFKLGRETLLQLGPQELSPVHQPDGRLSDEVIRELIERSHAGESPVFEWEFLASDGESIPCEVRLARLPVAGRRLHLGSITDVTQRKRTEEERRLRQDELARVSRVSTMGEMATGLAHELNQPLAAIASYGAAAKMMLDLGSSDPTGLREVLGKLEHQAIRAGDIVRRLRNFIRKTESTRADADLDAIIREAAKFVEPDLRGAETVLTLEFDKPSSRVVVDQIQIQQVLVNLIRNAIDAMRETPADQRRVTAATRTLRGGQVEVTVSDAGKGLAQDELEQ
ncbi:MAG: PAS domain S-box protein, partial [Planctomycetales bacterium]